MRLFKRKSEIDDVARCPECRERVPDGATACAMCGCDLTAAAGPGGRARAVWFTGADGFVATGGSDDRGADRDDGLRFRRDGR